VIDLKHKSRNIKNTKPLIFIKRDISEMSATGADILISSAKDDVLKRGRFTLAVSGGSSPRPLYRLLAEEPYVRKMPWSKTHIFWVDERCVPDTDPASNYGTAERDLLDKVSIPKSQVHPMHGSDPPEKGAHDYQNELKTFFHPEKKNRPVFDLVVLGIGTDGHTASLFPGLPALDEKEKWVVAVKGGDPDVHRLTLTLPVLNAARRLVFIASGQKKAEIIKEVFTGGQPHQPARRIRPASGELIWLMDRKAAALLPREVLYDDS
jgi:6-phosphogluconolactonase